MKRYTFLLAGCITLSIAFVSCRQDTKESAMIKKAFETAVPLYRELLQETAGNFTGYPRTLKPDGSVKYAPITDWTGGFWPGILWYMYEYTQDTTWKTVARAWTNSLESNQFNTAHHDIGFMMYNSYGHALRMASEEGDEAVLVESARSLCKRYSPVTGCIQSWNKRNSKGDIHIWEFPVIIDNMMNLELLFFASTVTGDTLFRSIAVQHAMNTLKNHLRPDYSSYHVVNYDPQTGEVLHRQTMQGFSDESTWSRGQAWGMYGFTVCYRETKDDRFLAAAEGMADFFLDHPNLPEDQVPLWDFNAGEPGFHPDWDYQREQYPEIPRDASAAAIAASALLELSTFTADDKRVKYEKAAETMLASLSTPVYMNTDRDNPFFLLKHSTGNLPSGGEVDVPLIYADYYFLEALLRYGRFIRR